MALTMAFSPGATVTLAVTATSASTTIAAGNTTLRITNAGPNTAFVRYGTGTQTAVVTDYPVLSGSVATLAKPFEVVTVAAICAATQTATLYLTVGEGGV